MARVCVVCEFPFGESTFPGGSDDYCSRACGTRAGKGLMVVRRTGAESRQASRPAAEPDPQPKPSEFCKAMRRRRQAMGLTQGKVATAVGVTDTMIASWETGRYSPSLDSLDRWARALNLAVVLVPASDDPGVAG